MIQLQSVGKRFGHKLLFDNIDWLITPRDRVGLVGGNGTGKSTLMKMIAGLETPDTGQITVIKGTRVGYLPQDGLAMTGRTVFAEALSVFEHLKEKQRELESLGEQLSRLPHESAEYNVAAERFHSLESELRTIDAYSVEAHVGAVLGGLGFPRETWTRRTEEFSGGWQMRLALAKLLLEKPNMLLLDEPTNHLDLEARNWLEDYLTEYPHAYILISHDRYFLDRTIGRTLELWNKRAQLYVGNYSKYETLKIERRAQLEAAYRNQRERIEQLEAFINRFRAQATKAKQVQSRIKELEKIELIEIPPEEKVIHFKFPQPPASGRIVAEFKGVSKSYGEKQVLKDVNFLIERGDRVVLVGVNGAGKSTLIKLLSGLEPLTDGEFKLGHNVDLDYFAQDQYKALDPNNRMFDDLRELAPRETDTELRNLLGCFLFSEDDAFKQIGVLSGGERNRYALAKLLLRPSNFLLLDEPTNHLDLRAKDILLDAIRNFTGTVVFVSHDRYFIDQLATRVFEVAEGTVHVYPSNYEDYLFRKSGQAIASEAAPVVAAKTATSEPLASNEPLKTKRLNPQRMKQLTDRCEEIEEEVARLEAKAIDIETALSNFRSVDETLRMTTELDQLRTRIDQLTQEWEQTQASIEEQR